MRLQFSSEILTITSGPGCSSWVLDFPACPEFREMREELWFFICLKEEQHTHTHSCVDEEECCVTSAAEAQHSSSEQQQQHFRPCVWITRHVFTSCFTAASSELRLKTDRRWKVLDVLCCRIDTIVLTSVKFKNPPMMWVCCVTCCWSDTVGH